MRLAILSSLVLVSLLWGACSTFGQPLNRKSSAGDSLPITENLATLRLRLEHDQTGFAAAQLLLLGTKGQATLEGAFRTGNAVARRAAVWVAGNSDDPRIWPMVAKGLMDSEPVVADQALRAVWTRPERFVSVVSQELSTAPEKGWNPLLRALSYMGDPGAEVLVRYMRRAASPRRAQIASALVSRRRALQLHAVELTHDRDPAVRLVAYQQIVWSSDKNLRKDIYNGLDDSSSEIRLLVSSEFPRFIAPSALGHMLKAAKDPIAGVRANAAKGLGHLHYIDYSLEVATPALDALFEMLNDSDESVLVAVAGSLRAFTSMETRRSIQLREQEYPASRPALKILRDRFENLKVQDRLYEFVCDRTRPVLAKAAAMALGCFRDRRALTPLLALLEQGNGTDPYALAQALGTLGDKAATKPLMRAIAKSAKIPYHSSGLISAFEGIADPEAAALLQSILANDSEDEQRRSAAGRTLGRMSDPASQEAVIKFVLNPSNGASIRGNVVYGLAWIPKAEAYDTLVACLADPTLIQSRWQVIAALGARGDPRAISVLEPFLTDSEAIIRSTAKDAVERLRRLRLVQTSR